ncbi:1-deoxy-D-xylulose-5-phosphate reductoisomerase [Bacillaceae bacterium]
MKKISVLGSTGSIGRQTLDVVAQHPGEFSVVSLAAGTNIDLLCEQIERFSPQYVSVASPELAAELRERISRAVEIGFGDGGLVEAATHPEADFVVTAVVGSRGLVPTLAAIESGKAIGLANKETLVTAGHLVMEKARERGVNLLPIDSEHSAIFQCLQGESPAHVRRIILTASGGAFRDKTREELKNVKVEDALNHPNWRMGAKITVDSATMMNKGLEVIEAHWLFQLPYSSIEVLIHHESIIHSMVEFKDRAVVAQLGTPDMRVPILYALSYPDRLPLQTEPLDLAAVGALHFQKPDFARFPCLRMAYECGRAGGTYPTVLNAANEIAVEHFLRGNIPFLEIENVIAYTLERHASVSNPGLEAICEADRWARETARRRVFSRV